MLQLHNKLHFAYCIINFPGWVAGVGVLVVGKAENIATQPSLAGAWAELGNLHLFFQ